MLVNYVLKKSISADRAFEKIILISELPGNQLRKSCTLFFFLRIHKPDLIAVFLQEIVGHSGNSISNFPFPPPLHLLQNRKGKLQLQPDLRTQSYVYSTDF